MRRAAAICVAAAAMAALVPAAHGELSELRRGGSTVKFGACPMCPMRVRFAPDAATAFLNTSAVAEKDRPRLAERAFALMAKAADAKRGVRKADGRFFDIAAICRFVGLDRDGARGLEENPFVLTACGGRTAPEASDGNGSISMLVANAEDARNAAVFVALCNRSGSPREADVVFAALGLSGRVQVLDLAERTDDGDFSGGFRTTVPPHSAKLYRLDAEERSSAGNGG